MHKIYIDKGLFDLEYQIPLTIYSSLISILFDTLIKFLALSDKNIIEFKQNTERRNVAKRSNELNKKIKILINSFFIFGFLFLLLFWYYIFVFDSVYINTQFHLLNDTLISIGLSLVFSFVTCLLPGIFRIPSLSNPKKNRKCLFKFNNLLNLL